MLNNWKVVGLMDSNVTSIAFMEEDLQNKIIKQIDSKPIDHVVLDDEVQSKLKNLWMTSLSNKNEHVPNDVVLSGVPVHDIIIEKLDPNDPKKENVSVISARIIIDRDLLSEAVDNVMCEMMGVHCIGIVVLDLKFVSLFFPIGISSDNESIMFLDEVGFFNKISKHAKNFYANNTNMFDRNTIVNELTTYMQIWYGVQISLIHPVIKYIFKEKSDNSRRYHVSTKTTTPEKPAKIKYVKRRIINSDDFERAIRSEEFQRKTFVWYVTGHTRWQHTRTGYKKVFVEGYWKGPLRETKNHMTRDREFVINKHGGEEHRKAKLAEGK